jgi:hypothetical protein
MHLTECGDGFVIRCAAAGPIAVGPRCALLPTGELVCSCMLTAGLGTNDFVPVLYLSTDLGSTWSEQVPIWPHLRGRWSIFISVSGGTDGRLFLFGSRTSIDRPGEPFWCGATQGLKQNELIWAVSENGGRTWSLPAVIPMPIPGAAEAPGALCRTRVGRWLAPFSPYNTFDPGVRVARDQVIVVHSDDQGRTWDHTAMLRFAEPESGAAEAWVIELSDGRLLGTCWHLSHAGGEHPNAYALSADGGRTWSPTRSTGILGQSTALAAQPDGRALFVYNQRRHGEPGVWLALVRPTETDFGVEANEIVWRAQTRTQTDSSGEHAQWEDFSFGEPCVTPLPNGTCLITLWCIQPSGGGIRWVRLRMQR